jgi:hypothetical protein
LFLLQSTYRLATASKLTCRVNALQSGFDRSGLNGDIGDTSAILEIHTFSIGQQSAQSNPIASFLFLLQSTYRHATASKLTYRVTSLQREFDKSGLIGDTSAIFEIQPFSICCWMIVIFVFIPEVNKRIANY